MFKSLVAVVTGGASGLGRATVERLAAAEARVVLCDLPSSSGKDVAKKIGSKVAFEPLDVTNTDNLRNFAEKLRHTYQHVDVLVNCAGVSHSAKVFDTIKQQPHSIQDFKKVIEVNTIGTFNVIRYIASVMYFNQPDEEGSKGVIINTAGISAYEGRVGEVACAASHGALASMTLPLARDVAVDGIRVVCIAPGLFDTPMTRSLHEKVLGVLKTKTTYPKRLGDPSEFASLVEHIIQNKMLNAEVIRLDAGMRLL